MAALDQKNIDAAAALFQPKEGEVCQNVAPDPRGFYPRSIYRNGRWWFYDYTEKSPSLLIAEGPKLSDSALAFLLQLTAPPLH